MKAVVMAGGEGSRLRPITIHRPKPLVPVGNKPIMGHVLELLARHGVRDVVATVHYLANEVQSAFGDGGDYGIALTYSVEDSPLGTAGSVKQAEAMLEGGTFFIISGDALTDCDLTAALRFHREKGSLATLVLSRVASPLEYGVVITDEEGRIQRFLEKPSWSEVFSDTVNTGIYILEPEVLATMDAGKNYDWSRDIFPRLLREGKPMFGYVMDGYWADVGTLEQYREAQVELLSGKVALTPAGVEASPGIWIGDDCQIDSEAVLEAPVCIGPGTKVKAGARIGPSTSVGAHGFVEEGAIIERSVLAESAYVGPQVQLRGAILGSRVTIKRDSTVNEDAVIGDRCLLDVGCTTRTRVKLWPDKIIERGSTVTMSLIYGNAWKGSIFRELGVAGLSNIEITPEFATRLGSAFGTCLPPRAKVVTSRDSTRSSRMIKRAVIASLLSVGCDVLDLRSAPVPVARHFIRASGAVGAINVRKLPGNSRVTLIEFYDGQGAYIEKAFERKVENIFFREDFRRTDPDDLGEIEFASRAVEEYQGDFFRLLEQLSPAGHGRRIRLVCDYGYSALAGILPPMLERLGVEAVSLNTFNNAKAAPRTPAEVSKHLDNIRHIVRTLGYDMGALFTNEGERLTCVDDQGRVLEGPALAGVLGSMVADAHPGCRLVLTATAPDRVSQYLSGRGARIERAKVDPPSLFRAALDQEIALAADGSGGFIFPLLHSGFDAAFALGAMLSLLGAGEAAMSDLANALPAFSIVHEQVPCDWDAKGAVMRRLAEAHPDADLTDGIKVADGDGWALALPDATEPWFHVYAEGGCVTSATARLKRFVAEVSAPNS